MAKFDPCQRMKEMRQRASRLILMLTNLSPMNSFHVVRFRRQTPFADEAANKITTGKKRA